MTAIGTASGAMVIAGVAMAALPSPLGLCGFVPAFILLAPSYQLFLAAQNISVMEGALENHRGVTSRVLYPSRKFGFVLSAGAVSKTFWPLASHENNIEGGTWMMHFAMSGTFAMSAVLVFGVVLLSVLSR